MFGVSTGTSAVIALVALAFYYPTWLTDLTKQKGFKQWTRSQIDHEKLTSSQKEHTKEYRTKRIIQVTDNIHVAFGYALANSVMIEGSTGVIIVDVTESYNAAKEIYANFKEITKKPVVAVIYTHNHADHMMGGQAFVEGQSTKPEVWAHKLFPVELKRTLTITNQVHFTRAMRQFGALLSSGHLDSGIGPKLVVDQDGDSKIVHPTKLLTEKKLRMNIGGLEIELVHIPGETDDQIGVWVPSSKTFISADDIYKAFPNLYAIRGTPNRDLLQWANSIDIIRDYKPEILVPMHSTPIEGVKTIAELLTIYRDAIQYVHDQTVRHMNKGLTPDEIVELVVLPPKLSRHPYLQEFYGTVPWSVRGTFNGYLGWFSGDPVDLNPMSDYEHADRIIYLAGGTEAVTREAKMAIENTKFQWALELATYLLLIQPDNKGAQKLKVDALEGLALQQVSMNGRNYYFTCAEEALGLEITPSLKNRKVIVNSLPIRDVLELMSRKVIPEKAVDHEMVVGFNFTDTNEVFKVNLRNCIAELIELKDNQVLDNLNGAIETTTTTWKAVVSQDTSIQSAYLTGSLIAHGGIQTLKEFFDFFDTS